MLATLESSGHRILCLHGRGSTGALFLEHALAPLAAKLPDTFELHALEAPSGSGSWWTYPKGERSFSASAFFGADESIAAVEAAMVEKRCTGILGFSQGAMLGAVVAARASLGEGKAADYLKFAVICGACLPAPFEPLFSRLRDERGGAEALVPVLHCLSANDDMNPPELGESLAQCFGGSPSSLLWHDGGHVVPPEDRIDEVVSWLNRVALQ